MEKDLATINEINNFLGKYMKDQGINPLHGLTLVAMALREATVNMCSSLDIPAATGLAFVSNSILPSGSIINVNRPSNGCDMKGC